MAINLRVAAGGAAKRYLQKKDEHEAFLREMDLTRREYLAEEGKATLEEIKNESKAAKARVKKGMSFGYSEEAAVLLELSGQLKGQLKRLDKLSEDKGERAVNKRAVQEAGDFVVKNVPEEAREAALDYISNGGYPTDIDEIQNRFFNVLLSVTGTTEEAAKILREATEGGPTSIDPIDVNTRGFVDMSQELRSSLLRNIRNSLQGILDVALDDNGNWRGEDALNAQRITNDIFRETRKMYLSPGTTYDPGDYADDLIESVRIQRTGSKDTPGKTLQEIKIEPILIPSTELPSVPNYPPPSVPPKPKLPSTLRKEDENEDRINEPID
jgi:hypothetical protein